MPLQSRPTFGSSWRSAALVALALLVLVPALILLSGITTVQAYERCLLVRGGRVAEEWGPGLHWRFTPFTNIACYRTARTTYEASPGQKGAGADYQDDAVEARSKDGQRIDAVSFRIAFSVPEVLRDVQGNVLDPDNLRTVYARVGARGEDDVVDQVVAFYARPEVRRVMQLHSGEELLQGDLGLINAELEDRLRPVYLAHGVVLESVLLSKPDFNDEFEARLQQREQAAVDVEIEAERARQASEQGRARVNAANADATVAAIVADAEAARAVVAAGANATVVAVAGAAEAGRTVQQANAEATAVAVQIAAHGGADAYLAAQHIRSMGNWPVQVLGDGDAVPVLVLTPASSPAPTR